MEGSLQQPDDNHDPIAWVDLRTTTKGTLITEYRKLYEEFTKLEDAFNDLSKDSQPSPSQLLLTYDSVADHVVCKSEYIYFTSKAILMTCLFLLPLN